MYNPYDENANENGWISATSCNSSCNLSCNSCPYRRQNPNGSTPTGYYPPGSCPIPIGPPGPPGPQGIQGLPGAPGADGIGAIIPFSTGSEVSLGISTGANDLLMTILGQSTYATENSTVGASLSFVDPYQSLAFTAPRNMTISSIAITAIGKDVTTTTPSINLTIYTANGDSTVFTPLTGNNIVFAAPATNAAVTNVTDTSIAIAAGTRVLLVAYASSTALSGEVTVYLHGSLAISSLP